jgi:hypothetical protein
VRNLSPRQAYFYYRDDAGRVRSVRGPAFEQLPAGVRLEHRRVEGSTGEPVEELVGHARVGGEEEDWTEVGRIQIEAVPDGEPLLAGIAASAGVAASATSFRALRATVRDVALVPETCSAPPGAAFRRADANADGKVDISDGVSILGYLFLGGSPPTCLDAADADDSGGLEITDAIYVLNHLFVGGPAPPAPYPDCGGDATEDGLECEGYAGCD